MTNSGNTSDEWLCGVLEMSAISTDDQQTYYFHCTAMGGDGIELRLENANATSMMSILEIEVATRNGTGSAIQLQLGEYLVSREVGTVLRKRDERAITFNLHIFLHNFYCNLKLYDKSHC